MSWWWRQDRFTTEVFFGASAAGMLKFYDSKQLRDAGLAVAD